MKEGENRPSGEDAKIYQGKRPWRPPVQGGLPSPLVTSQEIKGPAAPFQRSDGSLSRELGPEDAVTFGGSWNKGLVLNVARDLSESVREELDLEKRRAQRCIERENRKHARRRRKKDAEVKQKRLEAKEGKI